MSRKMKDSGIKWMGEIPESWKILTNNKCFLLQKEIVGDSFDNYQLLSLTKRGVVCKDINSNEGKLPENWNGYQVVLNNQIILCLFDLDCSAVFSGISNYEGMISPAYKILSCKKIMSSLFAEYWFRNIGNDRIYKMYSKSLRYVVNAGDFGNIPIVVPQIEEQISIANYLDTRCSLIDQTIEKQKQVIEKLKEYKQSVILETITKGLNPNVPMKDSGIEWIGEIPEYWSIKKIKYLTSISRGLFTHRPRNDARLYDGDYPFIQTGDVARAGKYITEYTQTLNELGIVASKEFPKGTLTMTIAANVGDVAILDFNAYFPDSVIGFIPKYGYMCNYLYYLFISMRKEFINNSIVSTQLNLNVERVKDIKAPIIDSIEIQKEISEYLDKKCGIIDSAIANKENGIAKLVEYKKSLIYECVTGKREVN